MDNLPALWRGPDGILIPVAAKTEKEIIPLASSLTAKQKLRLLSAFHIEAYDMAAEYAWKKAITKLKETISKLGMQFIGEMLGRDDITESTPYDRVLTDYNTIVLSEQLGIIGTTAGLQLRHSLEIITHYFSEKADEDLDFHSSLNIVKNAVKYILGYQDMSVALEFQKFRDRILNEPLKEGDGQVQLLVNSPLFYTKTVCFVLLSGIKNERGAKLEHALANINLLLPLVWEILSETDKWNIGSAYRDVVAEGNNIAASGLKQALLKINGFDYVPENLRSNTYKLAAKNVVETHFAFNNFYNEPAAVKALANLGTTIPAPALIECLQAYLIVCIGNKWGISDQAVLLVKQQLSKITKDRWRYYFEKGIHNDEIILWNFDTAAQVQRFSEILKDNGVTDFKDLPKDNQKLYDAILKNQFIPAKTIAEQLYNKLREKK